MDTPPLAELQAIIHRGVPLAEAWGIELLAAEAGTAVVRLPAQPLLLRPGNTVSGPALMGLADVAMWAALLSVSAGRDESVTSTMTVISSAPPAAARCWPRRASSSAAAAWCSATSCCGPRRATRSRCMSPRPGR